VQSQITSKSAVDYRREKLERSKAAQREREIQMLKSKGKGVKKGKK
tara:strand:- start:210 stop:347 length:138 start_codon:yes stop_codon:yes gene_type:complete